MPGTVKGGRSERRFPRTVAIQLVSEHHPLQSELAITENTSSRGARVRVRRPRNPDEHVLLQSMPGDFRSVARVAYCHRLSAEEFVVGLHFLETAGEWIINPSLDPGTPSNRPNRLKMGH